MGITVSYRGSIADLARVEDMEDRVIDLALEVGGTVESLQSDILEELRQVRGEGIA
ncbi:MAG: hypothetical protein GXX96_39385 [Planctomycetaceae bacterium]|nr:hypothetical protein [Planctomycetaceae bacterium]